MIQLLYQKFLNLKKQTKILGSTNAELTKRLEKFEESAFVTKKSKKNERKMGVLGRKYDEVYPTK
jgi:hypothetical protein